MVSVPSSRSSKGLAREHGERLSEDLPGRPVAERQSRRASADVHADRAERYLVVIDALVGVGGDEQVVRSWFHHGAKHFPVGGPEVLAFIDDDVPVPVAEFADCRVGDVADAVLFDSAGSLDLIASGAFGGLSPGLDPGLVHAGGVLLDESSRPRRARAG